MKVTCTVSLALLAFALLAAGCKKNFDPAQATGTPAQVVDGNNNGLVQVNHSEQFALISAASIDAPDKLSVTGSVFPDINREVPVISLASGKVVELRARLDDNVRKGQLLFKVQSPDISAAFDVYLKAVNDEQMSNKAYLRAKDLYEHGAIALGALEQAEDAEKNARADLEASDQQMATLGIDKQHPSSIVSIYAPIGGVVVGQNITNAAAAGVTYAGTSWTTGADNPQCLSRKDDNRTRERHRPGARSNDSDRQGTYRSTEPGDDEAGHVCIGHTARAKLRGA
jgi:cobalt-zinc-cadmium efflux system membrane fusion protein